MQVSSAVAANSWLIGRPEGAYFKDGEKPDDCRTIASGGLLSY
jgi:hypothetical protein